MKNDNKTVLINEKIDIVIPWLDGSDLAWITERTAYENKNKKVEDSSNSAERWRNWDNLQYIFRGIDQYMPWVNKVHLVTWGHLPKWLNMNCSKLHIVYHKDFIPEKYLPTFNSRTISLNFYKIPGLAEQFILFDDDMFVIAPTKPTDFFKNGKPKDMAVLSPMPVFYDVACATEANNLGIINEYFTIKDIKKEWLKWYSLKSGKYLLRTLIFSHFHTIIGIFEPHVPYSYLKETFSEVWKKEPEILNQTCKNKFRTSSDVSHWICRYWQIMSGNFKPRRWNFGVFTSLPDGEARVLKLLKKPGRVKLLCINDSKRLTDFESTKRNINAALEMHFPEKSIFEI